MTENALIGFVVIFLEQRKMLTLIAMYFVTTKLFNENISNEWFVELQRIILMLSNLVAVPYAKQTKLIIILANLSLGGMIMSFDS